MDFKQELIKLISKETEKKREEIEKLIETPKDVTLGDYALPCFTFAKEKKKNPAQIAQELAQQLTAEWFDAQNTGPYINFKIKKELLAKIILEEIQEPYTIKIKENKKIGIESPSPNANKPLHLGHARNMLLGLSLKNIYSKAGNEVIWFDLVNDKGVHICKSMLAYQLKGEGKTPKTENRKPDQFVGDYYVEFAKMQKENPELENEAKKMLVKWEQNDPQTVKLWKQMREWWLEGVKQTYKDYNVKIDNQTFESDIYKQGKQIVLEGVERGIFQKDEDSAIYIDLEEVGLGKKYLLRSDGTSIYMTQDIYLAKKRFEENELDEFRYVVGSEQIYHFKTLFEVFKRLKFDFAEKCKHISYGLIYLPDGKMKSREGNVVDADEFKEKMRELAKQELKKRYKDLKEDEIEKRTNLIATGAVNFFILKYDAQKDFTYYPEKSLSFQGESGPYIQYTHARICSILRKQQPQNPQLNALKLDAEKYIINKLGEYEDTIKYAAKNNKPSHITNYVLELAQLFNSYYQEAPILKEEEKTKNARLYLIDKVRIILKDALALLSITAPEEM